ncbi:MAG TPA: hypothetical protein VF738_06045 [Rhodanobacter sp.]
MKTSFRVHRYPKKPEINQIVMPTKKPACLAQTDNCISFAGVWRIPLRNRRVDGAMAPPGDPRSASGRVDG